VILNRLEFALMNNPVRAAIQRRFEAPRLRRMGGDVAGGTVLEIGCGRGVGTRIALEQFHARRVDAFDLDPRMVARARDRLVPYADRVALWVGDATMIPARNGTFDAVFDFGIIHHVPDWRRALAEVSRVLKPGGLFLAEEMLRGLIGRPVARRLFDHPQSDRFDGDEFVAGLLSVGLEPSSRRDWRSWVMWVVARKVADPSA